MWTSPCLLTSLDGRDTPGVRTVKRAFGVLRVLSVGVCTFERCCFIRSPRWLNKHKSQSKLIPLAGLSPAQMLPCQKQHIPGWGRGSAKCKSHTEVIVSHFQIIYLLVLKWFLEAILYLAFGFVLFWVNTSRLKKNADPHCISKSTLNVFIIFKIDQAELRNDSSAYKRGLLSIECNFVSNTMHLCNSRCYRFRD